MKSLRANHPAYDLPMPSTLVWISGGSSGIGAALAATVPYDDARVIDISRSGAGPAQEHLPADLADPTSWSALEAHFAAQVGSFEGDRIVMIHAAGVLEPIGYAGEVDSASYRRSVLTNAAAGQMLGHAFLRAAAPRSIDSHLVMISSGAASTAYEGWTAYSAGKAALEAWVRAAGAEQAHRSSRCQVIAVRPGVVATHMQEQIRAASATDFPAVERFRALHADGDLADPAEAARRIWGCLDRDLPNGAVVDVRGLIKEL